jgi:hypothetical protein
MIIIDVITIIIVLQPNSCEQHQNIGVALVNAGRAEEGIVRLKRFVCFEVTFLI